MKVFLGGTTNDSTWRDKLITMLKIDYFNPVVKSWTEKHKEEELKQREECDFVLYTITEDMMGVYSIAEVVDDSNKRPESTIFCVLKEGIPPAQLKSLQATAEMVVRNGGKSFTNLRDVAKYLNEQAETK